MFTVLLYTADVKKFDATAPMRFPGTDNRSPMDKPQAPATERNREPILTVLQDVFSDRHAVLDIGSGTGQHAAHFARAMPWLRWQSSDVAGNLPGISLWLLGKL